MVIFDTINCIRLMNHSYIIFRGIPSEEKRYQEVESGRIKDLARMRTGSRVIYQGPGEPEVPGLVRYLGQGPDGRSGWVLGLEILVSKLVTINEYLLIMNSQQKLVLSLMEYV